MDLQPGPLLFHPALLDRQELTDAFLVRRRQLEEIVEQIRSTPSDDSPQHLLVLGRSGMGKTLLLNRLACAVEEDRELAASWLPVLFNEQQHNIGELADFWLNGLEMVGVATGSDEPRRFAGALTERYRGSALEEAARGALREQAQRLDRRLLLLVDNLDGVFERIDSDLETSRLRELLQEEPWPMLVGTSRRAIAATYEYGRPFYQMFRVMELAPLSESETFELLDGLAERFGAAEVARLLDRRPRSISKLHLFMRGNPRTVTMLFNVLREGPDRDLRIHLERLLNGHTDLYRGQLEQLPRQAQRVFDALARRWDPSTAEEVAIDLRLARSVVCGQLHRLVERRLVEKINIPGRAMGFQLRDRLFNLWCLMRDGRSGRLQLRWLVEFIRLFYTGESAAAPLSAPGDPKELLADIEGRLREGSVKAGDFVIAESLAREGDDEIRLEVRRLAGIGLRQTPKDPELRLLLGRIEMWLGRLDRALQHLQSVLDLHGIDVLNFQSRHLLLATFLELARAGAAVGVLELMEQSGLDRRWLPLAHALAISTDRDPERRERLAPETRALTEDVLAAL